MTKEEITIELREFCKNLPPSYHEIDEPMEPIIGYFQDLGFITFASCSSHIFNVHNKPVSNFHAYVAFWYSDDQIQKVKELMEMKLPKSKYFKIEFNEGWRPSAVSLDIMFYTRYNRIRHLRRIFRHFGVTLPNNIKLPKYRHAYAGLKKRNA